MEEKLSGKAREEFWREIVSRQSSSGLSCKKIASLNELITKDFCTGRPNFVVINKDLTKSIVQKESDFISLSTVESANVVSEQLLKSST